MAGFDNVAASLSQKGEPVGRLVARAGQQLAAREAVPDNPGTNGHSGVGAAAEGGDAGSGTTAAAPANAEGAPAAEAPGLGARILAKVGQGFAVAIDIEQRLSAPLSAIPFPAGAAMCVGDTAVGMPHAHNHPPNLTPPNPVPVPLPGTGPVIAIPYVSGAVNTFIEGRPAARCGDMGMSLMCGGFFPMFELFLGSSNVWVEGARQARGISDISKHCVFTTPKPSDPPIGPMVGMTFAGTSRTFVGGVPMPSLLSLALGAAFKGAFKGVGAAIKKARTPGIALARFLEHASLHGDDAWKAAVKKDLARMARTAEGRSLFNRIIKADQPLAIRAPNSSPATAAAFKKHGPHCQPLGPHGHVGVVVDPNGPYEAVMRDGTTRRVSVTTRGAGDASDIVYDPAEFPMPDSPGTPSDVVLAHEMNHAANNAEGAGQGALKDPDPQWQREWTNHEEKNTVASENRYRAQRGGVPQRENYSVLP
jgi:hypothetical protein